ncbi:hypothetical protein STAS_05299 [Striga asiatica]|uniref:Uncharacterized protein n=1 Tax=Striga asiatica TaxID=4170 RepID=A0A5A7PA70_STRAF|nr:hypothetical protein STAS_05299 [Striga asiatica]
MGLVSLKNMKELHSTNRRRFAAQIKSYGFDSGHPCKKSGKKGSPFKLTFQTFRNSLSMAGSDSRKPLLTLIRELSSDESQGERRIADQKKRIEDLRSELDASSTALEESKRDKETTEQLLRGYEVELSMNEASIQALEARITLMNNEISTLGAELGALKSEESFSRDEFTGKMLELNAEIRKFQELLSSACIAVHQSDATLTCGSLTAYQDAEQARVVQNKLAEIVLQGGEHYKAEQVFHDQVQQELINLEKKALLLESVMKENRELQEMNRYP